MLRIVVTRAVTGETVLDSVGHESIVNMIAERFRNQQSYRIRISYP